MKRLTGVGQATLSSLVHIAARNDDDYLAPIEERAWSSPIYVNFAGG